MQLLPRQQTRILWWSLPRHVGSKSQLCCIKDSIHTSPLKSLSYSRNLTAKQKLGVQIALIATVIVSIATVAIVPPVVILVVNKDKIESKSSIDTRRYYEFR